MRTLFYMIGKYELTLYTFRYYWVESVDCYFARDDSSILRPDLHAKGPGLHPDSGTLDYLQLRRRRLAGRGLERRPVAAQEARRPTRGAPEE